MELLRADTPAPRTRACQGALTARIRADAGVGIGTGRAALAGRAAGRIGVLGPALQDVHVSLAHARGGWVAAVAADAPCGIDVEPIATSVPRGALTPREAAWVDEQPDPLAAFTRLWVRKEALVKAGAAQLANVHALDVLDDAGQAPASRHGLLAITEWGGPHAVGAIAVERSAPST